MIWFYVLVSVVVVSLVSLIGVFTLALNDKVLKKMLLFLVAFSSGALIGDTLLHLLPESLEASGLSIKISLSVFGGILSFFVLEKFLRWRHCHEVNCVDHFNHIGTLNLFSDAIHNFIDGLLIGASYLISIPLGIATTLAVILHEIPDELGSFGILLHSGFSKKSAIFYNFLSACFAILGAVVALIFGSKYMTFQEIMIPFTAGTFLYISLTDLIPELHKEERWQKSFLQLFFILLGFAIMFLLLFLEK